MNILLLSMPDSIEHTLSVSMRMPNGALSSLKTLLGLEDERTAFARYRPIRRAERVYL